MSETWGRPTDEAIEHGVQELIELVRVVRDFGGPISAPASDWEPTAAQRRRFHLIVKTVLRGDYRRRWELADDYRRHEAADLPQEPPVGEYVTDVHGHVWERLDRAGEAHWSAVDSTAPSAMVTWAALCAIGWTQSR